MTVILGIDPGSRVTGFGLIEVGGGQQRYLGSGVIRVQQDDLATRLGTIFEGVSEIIERYGPTEVAVEQVFMARNAASALKLGQARGAAIVAATRGGIPVFEYSARQIKLAVVGTGAAEKRQVQQMMLHLLALAEPPQEDAADALAAAICHANTRTSLLRVAGSSGGRRGRLR
jgi:crossover junction endodeoxyribonuclease RuvC